MLNRLLFVCLMGVIAACSTTIERGVERGSTESKSVPIEILDKAETSNDALQGLIDKAAHQVGDGDMEAGLATLERALRIAPRDASIYLSMAMVYQSLGESSIAANLARRGLLYCERRRLCRQLESLGGQ